MARTISIRCEDDDISFVLDQHSELHNLALNIHVQLGRIKTCCPTTNYYIHVHRTNYMIEIVIVVTL